MYRPKNFPKAHREGEVGDTEGLEIFMVARAFKGFYGSRAQGFARSVLFGIRRASTGIYQSQGSMQNSLFEDVVDLRVQIGESTVKGHTRNIYTPSKLQSTP